MSDPYPRRVLIVDFNHYAHKIAHGMQTPLTYEVRGADGSRKVVVTNLQNSFLKFMYKATRGAYDIPAICLDRPTPGRREYFQRVYPVGEGKKGTGYKASRGGMSSSLQEAISMTVKMCLESGISCYAGSGYEADDLIKATIDRCKIEYPDMPIHIVTGDSDMIPLVDDQISVFYRSLKNTYAESKDIELTKYIQVTPNNYEDVVSDLSVFKTSKLRVPYNTLLLVKMLRGDSSDEIPGLFSESGKSNAMPPRRVAGIIESMIEDGIDIENVFRFGSDVNLIEKYLMPYVLETEVLDVLLPRLMSGEDVTLFDEYFNLTESAEREFVGAAAGIGKDGFGGLKNLGQALKNYCLMDLNHNYEGLRKPAEIAAAPKQFSDAKLAEVASQLGIRIPLG